MQFVSRTGQQDETGTAMILDAAGGMFGFRPNLHFNP
jgi:hypothetical protein